MQAFISLDEQPRRLRSHYRGNGALTPVALSAVLGDTLNLSVFFFEGGEIVALPTGTTGKLTLKKRGALTGDAMAIDAAWTTQGVGVNTSYLFSTPLDNELLREAIGDAPEIVLTGTVEWTSPGTPTVVAYAFAFTLGNSASRAEDVPPPPNVEASWEWLKQRVIAGENTTLTVDDEAKTITVNTEAGGGGAWGEVTGEIADQTDLSAALAAKAATSHTHLPSAITGLLAVLDDKAGVTHTHAQSDITGLTSALTGKSNTGHTHAQSEVSGLISALSGKSNVGHNHAQTDITGLASTLAAKAALSQVPRVDAYAPIPRTAKAYLAINAGTYTCLQFPKMMAITSGVSMSVTVYVVSAIATRVLVAHTDAEIGVGVILNWSLTNVADTFPILEGQYNSEEASALPYATLYGGSPLSSPILDAGTYVLTIEGDGYTDPATLRSISLFGVWV